MLSSFSARFAFGASSPTTSPIIYTITPGTKEPVLGSSGQNPFPAAGWSDLVSSSADDQFINVILPFTWTYNGTGYNDFYPSSNTYITFGGGSTAYSGLSASNPPYDKIHIAGKDNSWQRVSSISSGTDYIRLRYEGVSAFSGTPGFPNMVYEITFFNPALTGGVPWFELLVGLQNRGTTSIPPAVPAISGIYSSSSLLFGGGLGPSNEGVSPNQSYVYVGDATGTNWTVYTGYYLSNTGY